MFTSSTLLHKTGKVLYRRGKVDINPSGFLPYSGQEDTVYHRNRKPLAETYIYTEGESVTKHILDVYSELSIQKTVHVEKEVE